MLAIPAFRAELDREALLEYFTFQNMFTDRTLFAGVRILPAGGMLRVSAEPSADAPERYWDFDFREPDGPESRRRSTSRSSTGSFAKRSSASSSPTFPRLATSAAGSIRAPSPRSPPPRWTSSRTFTVGFDMHSASGMEQGFDERERAEHMSYLFGTEHYEMVSRLAT